MFDIAPSEFMLLALVALIVIGPKDLPKAMRVVGRFVGKARGMASQFRSGFDAMVREAELEEMEKKWKDENARIIAEHSVLTDLSAPSSESGASGRSTASNDPLAAPAATADKST